MAQGAAPIARRRPSSPPSSRKRSALRRWGTTGHWFWATQVGLYDVEFLYTHFGCASKRLVQITVRAVSAKVLHHMLVGRPRSGAAAARVYTRSMPGITRRDVAASVLWSVAPASRWSCAWTSWQRAKVYPKLRRGRRGSWALRPVEASVNAPTAGVTLGFLSLTGCDGLEVRLGAEVARSREGTSLDCVAQQCIAHRVLQTKRDFVWQNSQSAQAC